MKTDWPATGCKKKFKKNVSWNHPWKSSLNHINSNTCNAEICNYWDNSFSYLNLSEFLFLLIYLITAKIQNVLEYFKIFRKYIFTRVVLRQFIILIYHYNKSLPFIRSFNKLLFKENREKQRKQKSSNHNIQNNLFYLTSKLKSRNSFNTKKQKKT